ncbi:MAG: ABC transporter ATP-binding protein/permease [Bdellovibrionales bacterium]|nr:ABC transporter ATP-binding protein/permease [Bdellovibrionales bacterium]
MSQIENKMGQWSTVRFLIKTLLRSDLKGVHFRIVISLILLVFAKVINVYIPFFYKNAVDALSKPLESSVQLVFWAVLSYALARIGSTFFLELKDYIFNFVSRRAQRVLSLMVFEKLHQLSLSFHLSRKTGKITRYIELGSRAIEFVLAFMLFNILPTLIEIALVTGILYYKYNLSFALITFVTIFIYIAATLLLTEWRIKYRRDMNESDSEANAKAVDSLLNFETVKYFGNEKFELKRYDHFLQKYENAAIVSQGSLGILNFFQSFIIAIGLFWVMILAGKGVLAKEYTVGDFVLVNTFLIQLYMPLNFLGFVYREIKRSLIDMENMFSILDEKQDIQDKENAIMLSCEEDSSIAFDQVRFSYLDERIILHQADFFVPSGKTLAIVGESGSGKSTIARLLFRFYEANQGKVKVGGKDVTLVTQESLRAQIGIVPQDTVLFNESIEYNIRYGRPTATQDEVIQAAKSAQIYKFIQSLPQGFDTVVGERGLKLSGGEKQRVAIARTILKNPKILILDEATSALDTQTEKEIQKELVLLSQHRTTLVIAHRLSTVTHADEIIVLDQGVIVERGSHDQLLALGKHYAAMWEQQRKGNHAAS